MNNIKQAVANQYGVTVEQINSQTCKSEVVYARNMVYRLIKDIHNKSLNDIGEIVGGKDHASVIHGLKTFAYMLHTDKETAMKYHKVCKQLERMTPTSNEDIREMELVFFGK